VAVLDSSALLAFLRREAGGEVVLSHLARGVASTANWSETLQKIAAVGHDAASIASGLVAAGLEIEPVWREDAELAATIWATNRSLALADRLCLATAIRLSVPALTADRSWLAADVEADIVAIR
jgi:PIN domain nuclease of toxin-antitoxin system